MFTVERKFSLFEIMCCRIVVAMVFTLRMAILYSVYSVYKDNQYSKKTTASYSSLD